MEVSSTVAQALTLHGRDDTLRSELDDQSFDLGDDTSIDVQAALGPFYKPFHSYSTDPVASTSQVTLDDVEINNHTDSSEAEEDAAMEARIAELEADAFSDNVANAMIADLKEIGMFRFISKYVIAQGVPLPKLLLVFGIVAPRPSTEQEHLSLLRALKITLSRALRNREPLQQYTTADDAARLLHRSRNIIVLTGAGVSTNCGIPDFRSSSGIYARLQASGRYPELTDPQEMFDIEVFRDNPEIFYSFAHELYPSDNVDRCSITHRWIQSLELDGKLLRNYTQNIDTLEKTAGIQRVLAAHGSFATASCIVCKTQYPGDSIKDAIFSQTVPMCITCTATHAQVSSSNGRRNKKRKIGVAGIAAHDESDDEDWVNPWHAKPIVKPDITFFGQALDDAFDRCLLEDREVVDLLIVIGTSLQVAPVSELLSHIPHRVPQILINRDPVPHVMDKVDVALLGDCDAVVTWLKARMHRLSREDAGVSSKDGDHDQKAPPQLAIDGVDNVWFFTGANREHRWIAAVHQAIANGDADSGSSNSSENESEGQAELPDGKTSNVFPDGSPLLAA